VIAGYNHNIQYKDTVFHVQTEDSGRDKAHMITLLYLGGNIIERTKTSYDDMLDTDGWEAQVSDMMQKQHKNMLRSLIRGGFDEKIKERSAGASFLDGPAPLNVEGGSQHKGSFGMAARPAKPAAPATAPTPEAPAPVAPPAAAPPPAPTQEADGTFATSGSLWDSLVAATPIILAEDMEKALDQGDDTFVFGEQKGEESLDEMMLGFMKGL